MPPMPPSAQRHGPTWFDKLKMGALMGGTVGGIMGFIYGTVTIFQYGAGHAGVMRTLGKYIVGSGATFRLSSWALAVSSEPTLLKWQLQYGHDRDILLWYTPGAIDPIFSDDGLRQSPER
ncbi:hypothetical protein PV08_06416 [Exophiala spinifera]|uniref:Protein MGR2 n=1 Tax=Exophiala spinifera TaxID=91928 RepID=A0A0D2BCL7_9EURO|nr:uncharacterized protein PV08_06416 [Exophiala spinifera]KIW16365.1 hypothetical protein PV08_06416 [Exophiala spinifera]